MVFRQPFLPRSEVLLSDGSYGNLGLRMDRSQGFYESVLDVPSNNNWELVNTAQLAAKVYSGEAGFSVLHVQTVDDGASAANYSLML